MIDGDPEPRRGLVTAVLRRPERDILLRPTTGAAGHFPEEEDPRRGPPHATGAATAHERQESLRWSGRPGSARHERNLTDASARTAGPRRCPEDQRTKSHDLIYLRVREGEAVDPTVPRPSR
jgi:hypothetical protein